ncbi:MULTISPECIES: rRNA maturation RNase YbeY [Runella]|jgi:rRNA maturation RNase YbeY|uniref:rRNA maturation RNase YbeY n=1 Tax=Runella TaxID=105 RepID=UPI000406F2CF|nr:MULTISPECIES: rRNA maturation RNase YbeY [Runella]AYQ34953.1 rRNA maturation RNase YbeY [Runella sp. SP2]
MIQFFNEDVDFKIPNPRKTKTWLKDIIESEGFELNQLNYIFCSDEYLLSVNQQYLNHDFYTDIITFDNSEEIEGIVEGDIFISIDRVKENAEQLSKTFKEELLRVLAHGVLHLVGYDDHEDEDELVMRQKEDTYIATFPKS